MANRCGGPWRPSARCWPSWASATSLATHEGVGGMNLSPSADVRCNGRAYALPKAPTVVVCLDGSEPGYIEETIAAGRAPTFARFMQEGASLLAESVIPSFTNPNNLSIITGRPPAVHGIAGN